MTNLDQIVVVSDNHGRPELLYAIDDFYRSSKRLIIDGDILDGNNSKGAIQAACDIGALLLLGNHEWGLLGTTFETDESVRYDFAASLWPRVHDRVLSSYGVYPDLASPANALRLIDKMPDNHKDLLLGADMFFETEDVLVIHGGVTSEDWRSQREQLEYRNDVRLNDNRYYIEGSYIPEQIQDVEILVDENVALSGLNKLLINGHFHRPFENFESRFSNDGKRLYLATEKDADFALVWEGWSGDLVRISSDGGEIDRYSRPFRGPDQNDVSQASVRLN